MDKKVVITDIERIGIGEYKVIEADIKEVQDILDNNDVYVYLTDIKNILFFEQSFKIHNGVYFVPDYPEFKAGNIEIILNNGKIKILEKKQ